MATIQRIGKGQLMGTDNEQIYPVTSVEAVEGLTEALAAKSNIPIAKDDNSSLEGFDMVLALNNILYKTPFSDVVLPQDKYLDIDAEKVLPIYAEEFTDVDSSNSLQITSSAIAMESVAGSSDTNNNLIIAVDVTLDSAKQLFAVTENSIFRGVTTPEDPLMYQPTPDGVELTGNYTLLNLLQFAENNDIDTIYIDLYLTRSYRFIEEGDYPINCVHNSKFYYNTITAITPSLAHKVKINLRSVDVNSNTEVTLYSVAGESATLDKSTRGYVEFEHFNQFTTIKY